MTKIDKHFKYLDEIDKLYKEARKLSSYNTDKMEDVICLCLKDIELAPYFLAYNIKEAKEYGVPLEDWLPNFPTFKRLSIIYEKQGKYLKAIQVCQQAVSLGFINDGTKEGMVGRINKLNEKLDNSKR